MKKLFKTLGVCLLAALTFTSCNKDDNNMDEYYKQLEQYDLSIDSALNAQKVLIEDYVNAHLTDAEQDSINYSFSYIDKKTKRGIWYFLEEEGNADSYTYKFNSSGQGLIYPQAKLKYRVKLLDGTVVESDEVGSTYNFGIQSSKITEIWFLSFFPYAIKLNSDTYPIGGLTEKGLQEGSKITVVTPSLYAYGATAKEGIPANSPLVYEFEVLEIE